ncbi:MAG: tetratricopeptide repeat protein [bacterium]
MRVKTIVSFLLVLFVAQVSIALDRPVINPEDISIKAGPTEPSEHVQLVWLESYVFPKVVTGQRIISLGVRGTSQLQGVSASFDFGGGEIVLSSNDSLYWSGAFELPANVLPGLHVVRYKIAGRHGNIRRTVEFFVEGNKEEDLGISRGEAVEVRSWPLTIVATGAALVGGSSRIMFPGQQVVGVSKVPWYKVIFADGEEGWVSTSIVKEPLSEFYKLGYQAYIDGDYSRAVGHYKDCVAVDPGFVKAHFWLAKSYYRLNDLDAAYSALQEAARLDERNIDTKILASTLAKKFSAQASKNYNEGRYNEAVASSQKAVELKPTLIAEWVQLGKSYNNLGLKEEARFAWRAALKHDPQNKTLLALVGGTQPVALASLKKDIVAPKVASKPKENKALSLPVVASASVDDSLEIVRDSTTNRGTKVETALKSVVSLTKSLGTPVVEKGWEAVKQGDKYLVKYLCEQGAGVVETFEWLVDIDTKKLSASNDNARLLMKRW